MNPVGSDGLAVRPVQPQDRLHLQLLCCEHLMAGGSVPDPEILSSLVDDFAPRVRIGDRGDGIGVSRRKPKQGASRISLLAMLDGGPLAAAVVDHNPDHLVLRRLIVRPVFRRKGVGTYMVYRSIMVPMIHQERRRRGEPPRYLDAYAFVDTLDIPSNDMLRKVGFRAHAFLRGKRGGADAVSLRLSKDHADWFGAKMFGPESQWCQPFARFVESLNNLI